jgi:hypothetical protein
MLTSAVTTHTNNSRLAKHGAPIQQASLARTYDTEFLFLRRLIRSWLILSAGLMRSTLNPPKKDAMAGRRERVHVPAALPKIGAAAAALSPQQQHARTAGPLTRCTQPPATKLLPENRRLLSASQQHSEPHWHVRALRWR